MVSRWPDVDPSVLNSGGLSVEAADTMVENCIGCVSRHALDSRLLYLPLTLACRCHTSPLLAADRLVPDRYCLDASCTLTLRVVGSYICTASVPHTRASLSPPSVLSLPLGLGLNFIINGEDVDAIPMCVEEPSVIAATSGAAKLVAAGGGFQTSTTPNVMFGQIQLIGIGGGVAAAVEAAAAAITAAKLQLIEEANTYCASMKARGGGVVDITPRSARLPSAAPFSSLQTPHSGNLT